MKAKDKLKESEEENARLRKERDAALAHVARLKQDIRQSSSLTISAKLRPTSSTNPTPATSLFDVEAFPLPPHASAPTRHEQTLATSPTVEKSQKRHSRAATAVLEPRHQQEEAETTISSGHRFPAMEQHHTHPTVQTLGKGTHRDYFDANRSKSSPEAMEMQQPLVSLPTPPLSVDLDDQARRGLPVSANYTSRFKAFRERVFQPSKELRANSTPPPDVEHLHSPQQALRPESPWLVVKARSNSEPRSGTPVMLDPYANAFSPDAARRKFMPREWTYFPLTAIHKLNDNRITASMHLSGCMDEETVSILNSGDDDQSSLRPASRASEMFLEGVEVDHILSELHASHAKLSPTLVLPRSSTSSPRSRLAK